MKKLLSILLVTSLSSFAASAGSFVLSKYNVVTISDFVANGHVDGKTFIGGDLSGSTAEFGAHIENKTSLVVTGEVSTNIKAGTNKVVVSKLNTVNVDGANINKSEVGDKVYLNGDSSTGYEVNNATVVQRKNTTTLENLRDQYKEELESASKSFKQLTANSDLELGTNIVDLNINNTLVQDEYAVFSIDGSSIFDGSANGSVGMFTDVVGKTDKQVLNSLAGVIINVSGDNLVLGREMNKNNFASNPFYKNVIWNFWEAETITLNRTFSGTLLAPLATVTTNNSNIDGSVGVNKLILNGEIHLPLTKVNTPPPVEVPAPTPLLLIAIASFALILKRKALKV